MDSMNEDFIDNIITNLKILNLINVNEKLCVRKGHLAIDTTVLQFFVRWFNRDSRDVVLVFIKDLIKNITTLLQKISSYTESEWLLTRLQTEMCGAEQGLQNLKTTYSFDQVTVVAYENIIVKFRELISQVNSKLNVPKHVQPKQVK